MRVTNFRLVDFIYLWSPAAFYPIYLFYLPYLLLEIDDGLLSLE